MKDKLLKHKYLLGFLLFSAVAFASGVPQQFSTDILKLGNPGSTDAKQMIFDTGDGAASPTITVDMTDKDFKINTALQIVNEKLTLGTGANVDQEFIFNIGLGAANPRFSWDASESSLSFANDGINFKKIGSGAGGGGGFNLLAEENPDFESGTPPNLWNNSGSGVFSAETVEPLFGNQSGLWDASTAGDILTSNVITIPNGLAGSTCSVAFNYKFPGTLGDLLIEVETVSGVEVTTAISYPIPTSTLSRQYVQFFSCPAEENGTVLVRFKAAADAAVLTVDNVFVGSGRESYVSSQIKQQSMFGTAGSNGLTTAEDVTNFTISRNTGSLDLFEWTGTHIVALKDHYATIMMTQNSTNSSSGARIFEGPDGSSVLFSQSNCSNSTFDCTTSWSGLIEAGKIIRFNSGSSSSSVGFAYTATRDERTVDETLTVETSGDVFEAVIEPQAGTTVGLGTSNVSFGQIGGNFTLRNIKGNGFITCASTAATPDGVECTGSSETIGYAFTPKQSGNHEVCFNFQLRMVGAAGDGVIQRFYVDHQEGDRTLISRSLKSEIAGGYDSASGSSEFYQNINTCGVFNLQAGTQANFAVSTSRNQIVSALVVNDISGQENGDAGTYLVHASARNIDLSVPSPVFTDVQNSLREKLTGSRDNLAIYICSVLDVSPVTFDTTNTNCAEFIDSVVRNSVGNISLFFKPGIFSEEPTCIAGSTLSESADNAISLQNAAIDRVNVLTKRASALSDAVGIQVLCYGGK